MPRSCRSKLGIPADNVEIVFGDTDKVQFGLGTYGSRSLAVGGSALVKATDKIIVKGKKIAAHMLEASDGDIEFEDGVSRWPAPTGRRRSATWSARLRPGRISRSRSWSPGWKSRPSTIR